MSTFKANTPQLKTVKNLMDAFASFNFGKVAPLISKNFQYEVFNGVTDLGKLDRERYAEMAQGVFAGVTKADLAYHEAIEAPGKVVLHFSALCGTASGTAHPYDTLCIFSLEEEDGELKVISFKNFPDTQKHNALMAGAAKAAAERVSVS